MCLLVLIIIKYLLQSWVLAEFCRFGQCGLFSQFIIILCFTSTPHPLYIHRASTLHPSYIHPTSTPISSTSTTHARARSTLHPSYIHPTSIPNPPIIHLSNVDPIYYKKNTNVSKHFILGHLRLSTPSVKMPYQHKRNRPSASSQVLWSYNLKEIRPRGK